MKTSRACTGMVSSANEHFRFLKLQKHKKHMHHVYRSSRVRGTVLPLQTSISLTRNMNVK